MRYWESSGGRDDSVYRDLGIGMSQRFTPALKWLLIINIAVFLLQTLFNGPWQSVFQLKRDLAIERGFVWQLVTYAFMHAGLMHILFNMIFLYLFGREIELRLGTGRFLWFYLGAAAFTGLLFVGADYVFSRAVATPCVGASGAIFALMMVYALWWPDRVILFMLIIPMKMRTFVLIMAALETYGLIELAQGRSYGVAIMAHLGGLAYGFVVVKSAPWLAQFQALQRGRSAIEREADHRRVDELLDKVGRKGMNSLTWRERRFLKAYGNRRR